MLRAQSRDLSSQLDEVKRIIVQFIRHNEARVIDGETKSPRRVSWRDDPAMVNPDGQCPVRRG
ncbi:hypothetical protein ACVWXN_000468 [Bradyrhizobium sp. i1.4.4]|uniref:hypothetical protein n=1 Tax=Bradyrhizobium TaxID=374 RepID=UPI0013747D07|nr:hypothetical protein [Bradyrhizobium japonicum]